MSQAKTIPVPISGGMRQDVSRKMAPPGTLFNALNVRFGTVGEVAARAGTNALSALSTGGDPFYSDVLESDGCDFVAPCSGGFVVGAQGFSYRYDSAKGRLFAAGSYSCAVPYGRFTTMAVEQAVTALGAGDAQDKTPWPLSVAVGSGFVAVMWSGGSGAQDTESSGGLRCQIFTESGALVTTIVLGEYTTGWVLYDAVTGGFIVLGQQAVSGDPTKVDAALVTLASTGATLGSFANVATLHDSTSIWAAAPWPGLGWALVHRSGATTVSIQRMLSNAAVTGTPFTVSGSGLPFSVYADATHLYVGWVAVSADNDAIARVYDTALANTSGGDVTLYTDVGEAGLTLTPPLFGTSEAAASAFYVIGRATDLGGTALATTFMKAGRLSATGTNTTQSTVTYNLFPVSAPFANGLVWCRYRTPNGDAYGNNYVRYLLADYQNDRLTAGGQSYWKRRWPKIALATDAFADPQAGDYEGTAWRLHVCPPQAKSNGRWLAALPRLVRSEFTSATAVRGFTMAECLEFAVNEPGRQVVTSGGDVLVAGSPVIVGLGGFGSRNYATASFAEPTQANQSNGVDLGFFVEPSIATASKSNTADGALTALGVYQYRCVVEWIDPASRRWRSRPSRAQTVTLSGAEDTVTFTDADDFAWVRQGLANISAASTIVKHYYRTIAGGSTFYRVTPPQGAPLAGAGATFVDTMRDETALSHEILYTDGGVLDNDHPPSCRFIKATEDRVWLAGLWDKRQAQSSKIVVPGEPAQFSDSPAFRVVCPEDITGIGVQDGAVILFAAQSIYVISGEGPTDQGQGGWGSPRCITSSTGCINEKSILETSAGIFFESYRGIELLPRGLGEPQFVGAAVQDFPASVSATRVTACAVVKTTESTTARFMLGNAYVMTYDLDTGAWATDSYPVEVQGICDTSIGAIIARKAISGGGYGFYQEAVGVELDSVGDTPVAIASTLEWADLRPFGPAGQGRFISAIGLFSAKSAGYQAGAATIKLVSDRASEAGKTFTMSTALASQDYQRVVPAQAVGSSAALTLSTTVGGWRFMGWTVELEELGGGRRMAETEQG